MTQPLVTVICVCYNQARFVLEALDSVVKQTYPNLELIVIDDGSSDGSGKLIKRWTTNHPEVTFILNAKNIGYCKTFNKAWRISSGEFIIDLAADDVLLPQRVEQGVKQFQQASQDYGVVFSDAIYIDEQGKRLRLHSDKYPHQVIPQGDIYKQVILRYFICSPTMMFRKPVLDSMKGYDEALAFEDFDLWIRSARNFKFMYSDEALVLKRDVTQSMSAKQFERSSPQRWSTYEVCKKIKMLNQSDDENKALKERLRYECRVSLRTLDFKLAYAFGKLLLSL
jgi:glycosyltransferase involved in cell wall biosynthesis